MDQLKEYLQKRPQIVFEWKDSETDAEAWLVINSLKGGAAGGGTRMRKGLTRDEVVALAKVMEIKFNVCGPAIGGAKSGINFDPFSPGKSGVLKRWFEAVSPLLKSYYGTGGDLNVDEVKEVFPVTESLGIQHPQEGVLTGYFGYGDQARRQALSNLDLGCKMPVVNPDLSPDLGKGAYTVADMITGYGVAESVIGFYKIFDGTDGSGKSCLIQGWGNVAASAAYYLAQRGYRVIGILDREHSVVNKEGFSFEEIRNMFVGKDGNRLISEKMVPSEEVLSFIWDWGPDVFVPAAASRIVTADQLSRLVASGTELISCGANVPFLEDQIIYGDTSRNFDNKLAIIPDFIANCGMARTFNYLMESSGLPNEIQIFEDVSSTITKALQAIYTSSDKKTGLFERSIGLFV